MLLPLAGAVIAAAALAACNMACYSQHDAEEEGDNAVATVVPERERKQPLSRQPMLGQSFYATTLASETECNRLPAVRVLFFADYAWRRTMNALVSI